MGACIASAMVEFGFRPGLWSVYALDPGTTYSPGEIYHLKLTSDNSWAEIVAAK